MTTATRRDGKPRRRFVEDVIETFEPIRASVEKRIDVRILRFRGERRLDIREYVDSEQTGFQGYTRKGVSLSSEEFDALLAQEKEIRAALEGGS